MTYFPPLLRSASVVTRWGVIQTHGRDTIADHSYRVAMYAQDIAKLIKWMQGNDVGIMYTAYYWLMRYALIHDLDELFTGDTVTFVKSEIIDQDRAAHFVALQMRERMPGIAAEFTQIASLPYADGIKKIVKAADWFDSLLFIIGEQQMGNAAIQKYEAYSLDNFKTAWFNLPCDSPRLAELWMNEILTAVRNHRRLD